MKGIVLAGGEGTRLSPLTKVISKQILPIYDKPMIYYPISVLMLAGIKEILIISTSRDIVYFKDLLGDGSSLGINFYYKIQEKPRGLADAFILGEKFIGNSDVCLVLGDNLFYGANLQKMLEISKKETSTEKKAIIFGSYVPDPERYGVVEFEGEKIISLEEKPVNPKSNYAVVGLYFYTNEVIEISKNVRPSDRGEIEISSVNNAFLNNNKLKLKLFNRGISWLDTGTPDSYNDANNFIKSIENRHGLKIAALEEISLRMNYITKDQLRNYLKNKPQSNYYNYLRKFIT